MKILHVTDLHFRQDWFAWIERISSEVAAVCVTGDLLTDDSRTTTWKLRDQANWVLGWIEDFPRSVPLFLASGNHDWFLDEEGNDRYAEGRWLEQVRGRPGVAIDGDVRVYRGFRFVCASMWGAPEIDGSEPTVLLAHLPPHGTAVARDSAGVDVGDRGIAVVARSLPAGSLVLSGHQHNPARPYARIGDAYAFNPGADFSQPYPNHTLHLTDKRRACWWSGSRNLGPISLY